MRRCRHPFAFATVRFCACGVSVPALADLPIALHRLPGIPGLSMGCAAFGNGLFGNLLCPFATGALAPKCCSSIAHFSLAAPMAFFSTDVPVRLCEALEPRPELAQPDRTELSF